MTKQDHKCKDCECGVSQQKTKIVTWECPICKCELTSWDEKQNSHWVCDTCGFGKKSMNEYKTLQKIIKYRNQYFEYYYMKSFESMYAIIKEKSKT